MATVPPVLSAPVTIALATTLCVAAPLQSQKPDSFFVFPQRDRAELMAPRIAETCKRYAGGNLRQRQDRLVAKLAASAPDLPLLRELACLRSLQIGKMTGGSAAGLPLGSSWYDAAESTVLKALSVDPSDSLSIELLAVLTLSGSGKQLHAAVEVHNKGRGPLKEVEPVHAAATLYFAVKGGSRNPAVLRSCTSMLIRIGDLTAARDCSIRALDRGIDSTWHLLRLSALSLWQSDTLLGVPAFLAAAASSTSPLDRDEVGWHLEPSFDSQHLCLACWKNGIVNPITGYSQRYLKLSRLNAGLREEFRALPGAAVASWIQREVDRRKGDTLQMPIVAFEMDPSQHFTRTVKTAGLLSRNLLLHFYYTNYAWGTFRGCYAISPPYRPPCLPRKAPLADTYIGVSSALANLWNPATTSPMTLVAWAVPARDLAFDTTVTMEFRRWGLTGGTEWDTTVAMRRGKQVGSDALLMGSLAIPASDRPTVSLVVTQGRTRRGGLFRDDLTPLGTGDLEVSDPILGQAGAGVEWKGDSLPVTIAPLRTFKKHEAATLYYQVRSAQARKDVSVTATFYSGVDADGPFDKQLIAIRFPGELKVGVNGHYRELRMPDLDKGVYRLELTLSAGGQRVGQARSALFGIQ